MKKILNITLLFIVFITLKAESQVLEWMNVFDTHSIGFGPGINPNSLIDNNGKITSLVVENDTLKLYQTLVGGEIVNSLNSNRIIVDEYTPLIRVGQSEQAIVFKTSGPYPGFFRLLQTDSELNVVKDSQLVLPPGISFPTVQNLISYNGELYLTLISSTSHYLFKIGEDNNLSVVYSVPISIGYGDDYILLENGNIVFSYKRANGHIIRCVSLQNGSLIWQQTINRNHGILLEYKTVRNGNILYTAGLERAWVNGIADDELGISHIDINTGNILFQAPLDLPYCSGCFLGFEDFIYNAVNNHIYITYESGFPGSAVSIVEISNQSEDIIKQTYFPVQYDPILSSIGNRSRIYIRPDGQVALLYKSYKNQTEKTNLYIASLDSDLLSTGTLEINFAPLESVEHPTHVLAYDNSRILISGIIPDSNPNIFWEQVEFFTAMVNLEEDLSVENKVIAENEIMIYPNPAKEIVNVSVPHDVIELAIYDTLGKMIYKEKVMQESFQIDVSTYPSGIYFMTFSGQWEKFNKKLIVK